MCALPWPDSCAASAAAPVLCSVPTGPLAAHPPLLLRWVSSSIDSEEGHCSCATKGACSSCRPPGLPVAAQRCAACGPRRLHSGTALQGLLGVDCDGVLQAARPHSQGPLQQLRACGQADFDAPSCVLMDGAPRLARLAAVIVCPFAPPSPCPGGPAHCPSLGRHSQVFPAGSSKRAAAAQPSPGTGVRRRARRRAHGWSATPGAACTCWPVCHSPPTRFSGVPAVQCRCDGRHGTAHWPPTALLGTCALALCGHGPCSAAALWMSSRMPGHLACTPVQSCLSALKQGLQTCPWVPHRMVTAAVRQIRTAGVCRQLSSALQMLHEAQPLSGRSPGERAAQPVMSAPMLPGHPLLEVRLRLLPGPGMRLQADAPMVWLTRCHTPTPPPPESAAEHVQATSMCRAHLRSQEFVHAGNCSGARTCRAGRPGHQPVRGSPAAPASRARAHAPRPARCPRCALQHAGHARATPAAGCPHRRCTMACPDSRPGSSLAWQIAWWRSCWHLQRAQHMTALA